VSSSLSSDQAVNKKCTQPAPFKNKFKNKAQEIQLETVKATMETQIKKVKCSED